MSIESEFVMLSPSGQEQHLDLAIEQLEVIVVVKEELEADIKFMNNHIRERILAEQENPFDG